MALSDKPTYFVLWNVHPEELDNFNLRRFHDIKEANQFLVSITEPNTGYTKGSARTIIGYELQLAGHF